MGTDSLQQMLRDHMRAHASIALYDYDGSRYPTATYLPFKTVCMTMRGDSRLAYDPLPISLWSTSHLCLLVNGEW